MVVVGGSGVCMSKIGKSKSTMDDIAPITADDEREERNAKMQDRGTKQKELHGATTYYPPYGEVEQLDSRATKSGG